jgi:hypothetical protein
MKILFAPFYKKSHQIPLLVLFFTYFRHIKELKCSFLLPKSDHHYCELYQTNRLDFDFFPPTINENKNYINTKALHSFLESRNTAIDVFNPDIIIEDFCFDIYEYCEQRNIPIISIQRTGFFRTLDPSLRNPLHVHSIEKELINGRRQNIFSYKNYSQGSDIFSNKDYFVAKYALNSKLDNALNPPVKIIPGITSIEKLPSFVDKKSYYFSGPLIPNDQDDTSLLSILKHFFDKHKDKKKVFLTTGLIEQQNISEIFKHLVKKGYVIITTIFPPYDVDKRNIFFNSFFPLHYVSENVDLIIHHCGSGMYHFPLLHIKPSITIGTQCYDREDVAIQLQDMKLSVHVPSPFDDVNYIEKFMEAIEKFEGGGLCDFQRLEKIKLEITNTMNKFDIEDIINNVR